MKKKITFLATLFAAVVLTSCAKKEGCMDNSAINFDADAGKECNCCTYEGSIVLWVNQADAAYISTTGQATVLNYYFDGVFVGSTSAGQYWSGAPDCGQNGSMTVTKDLGESKSKAYELTVVDEDGYTWWTRTVNLDGNTCIASQLTL
jgi:hypothetical protein